MKPLNLQHRAHVNLRQMLFGAEIEYRCLKVHLFDPFSGLQVLVPGTSCCQKSPEERTEQELRRGFAAKLANEKLRESPSPFLLPAN